MDIDMLIFTYHVVSIVVIQKVSNGFSTKYPICTSLTVSAHG